MIAPLSYASEVVVLKDGRKVQLNDNFTWQYVQTDSQKKQETKPASAVPTIPVIKQQPSSSLTILGANKPTLQLEKSGVDVLLGALQYQSGKLIIPTSITNQGTESVILVTLDITITDAQGNVLTTQTVNVWESIKRLADTYLRPQSQSEGRTISLDVNKLKQYKISAAITQVVTR
ncbi:hypothetical protein VMF7928_03938 [Vibrio marisflavi CECT 7928]|uniref:Uncharacterized protein n=2 Tax=Vibrio marisflavi TaxID=1216040 RepID=A0ABM9A8B3_9VIBR|nr:hypothetical protein VMF7928_03938 [Vibrio marisflavi CECT 7928]